jgi:HSP90 family molecular chaperone
MCRYMEALLKNGVEVLYSYEPLDEVVFANVRDYDGKNFVSVETSNVKFDSDIDVPSGGLTPAETSEFCSWLKGSLGDDRVSDVVGSSRLVSHPAIIADDSGSGAYRRMMRVMDKESLDGVPPQKLEVNPAHPLVVSLRKLAEKDARLANLLAEQLYDNALVYVGRTHALACPMNGSAVVGPRERYADSFGGRGGL